MEMASGWRQFRSILTSASDKGKTTARFGGPFRILHC
ncbi:hypothetical protein HP15_499 [Marinobacter adhaerens HP15]|uniref:Uncharacterized protein n=1 Tax=Marinobacter adhaerens (strain DSM 23420 / HP15) TaxID=225937 RepID=E4PNE5_MARAH|nr:hypothetical protein HP15_499 [Marinobacter adhaerens HP15]